MNTYLSELMWNLIAGEANLFYEMVYSYAHAQPALQISW